MSEAYIYQERVQKLFEVIVTVKALLKGDYNGRTTDGVYEAITLIANVESLPYLPEVPNIPEQKIAESFIRYFDNESFIKISDIKRAKNIEQNIEEIVFDNKKIIRNISFDD